MTKRNVPPRILLLGNFLSEKRPGAFWVCESLAKAFKKVGWQVVTSSSRSNRFERLVDMVGAIFFHHRSYDIAIVEVYSGRAFRVAEILCVFLWMFKKTLVLTLHGGRLPEFAATNPRRVQRLFSRAEIVTAPSAWMCREMQPYLDNIVLIPNPIELDLYKTSRLPRVRPRLIWMRAFESFYCPEMGLEALDRLRSQFPDITLKLIGRDKGDGTLGRIRAMMIERGLSTSVQLIEGVSKDEVPKTLMEGDIFLNTSSVDNSPVCLLEALASGLIVVSTRVGGIPDLIVDRECGLLIAPGDVEAMVEAVRRLLLDEEFSNRLRKKGQEVVAGWGTRRVVEAWREILDSCSKSGSDCEAESLRVDTLNE